MTDQGRTIAPEAPPGPRPARPEAPPTRRAPSRVEHRAALRVRRRRRRKRLLAFAGMAALVVFVAALGLPWVGKGLRSLNPAEPAPPPVLREPSTLLLGWPTADDGDGAVVVLLGMDPERDVAGALLVPGRTQVEVPSMGSTTFGTTLRSAGGRSVTLALENAVGVDVTHTVMLDVAGLGRLLTPAGRFPARLREPVVVGDRRFRSGDQELATAQAVGLLTEREPDADDFEHLVAVHAVLEGWLAGLDEGELERTGEVLGEVVGLDGDVRDGVVGLLRSLSGADVSFDTLSVQSLGLPEERYSVDDEGVEAEVAALFPSLLFPGGADRPRVEILNGAGTPGIAAEVTERVVPQGFRVVLTGNAAQFGLAETLVVLQDERFRPEAERLIRILGAGTVRMARNPVSLVDVSIVVGADFDPGGG